MLAKLLKQPLVHFLGLGAAIFVVYALTADPAGSEAAADRTIVVDRAALLAYLQYREQADEPEALEARLVAMSTEEVAALVAAYVRDEALYREGLGLGIERADGVIRQRVVQRVEALLDNLVARASDPTDAELQAYYTEHRADYASAAVYTFTHIFFDGQSGMDEARARAEALFTRSADIPFEQSAQHGDRYPYLQNYVERTRDFVASNFSAEFVAQLDALRPSDTWQGPIAGRYGWHLVMLRARTEPSMPTFAEVRSRVLDDYRYDALLASRQKAEERVIAEYEVSVQLE